MKSTTFWLIAIALSFSSLAAQTGFPAGTKFLKGYTETVSGEILSYWSFHPLAKQSLLSRATTGQMAVEWKTEPVPREWTSDTLEFLWIGAFSTGTSKADHDFDFFVNGTRRLTFRTFMGGRYNDWSVSGSGGIELSYKHVWQDHVGDAHGYFCLSVPRGAYPEGKPLTLKVVGHASSTRDWYMTFTHAVRESAVVRSLPLLLRDGERIVQVLEVGIDYPGDSGSTEISLSGEGPTLHRLSLGWNAIELKIPSVDGESSIPIDIRIDDRTTERHHLWVRPVTHRRISLLAHSHNDIGYSDVQTTVLDIQLQNLRDALRLIEKTKDYPEGSRFKWNVEILWPIDSLLVRASEADRKAFLGAVRDGSIGLNALYVNPLTGIARPEVLMHLMDFARELNETYGISISTAMITDIPGTSWGIVSALAHSGVRYFSSGPNAGDRIGHYAEAWGDKPFYWVSPSGKDSVLLWVAGTGYSMFHATRTFEENQSFRQKLGEYLDRLDATGYPYELVQMRYSIYSDNGMTDSTMSDFVRQWNEHTVSPVLRIATTEELFREFEARYGRGLPSYAGDLTPYWEDGAASTAQELGEVQVASERLVQAEILSSMTDPRTYDPQAYADAWDAVNLWVEHTWGAWNSVSDPDEAGAVAQWKIKQSFAATAVDRTDALLDRALANQPGSPDNVIEVINTCSWPRSDVVSVPWELHNSGDLVLDESNTPVASQRMADGTLQFLAGEVPAFGTRRYHVVPGQAWQGDARSDGLVLSNGLLTVEVDSTTGTIRSLQRAPDGREFVDQADERGMNEFVYVRGTSPLGAEGDSIGAVWTEDHGGLVASIFVRSEAANEQAITKQIRLYHGLDRVDILNIIEKRKPVREKEAAYFRFPLAVADPVTRLDLGWGVIRPELDQLPGSCKDYFSIQRWVDVSSREHGVTWATVQAPLVELGEISDETSHNSGPTGWKRTSGSSSLLYSFVLNNYWHTNYKADQSGMLWFQYSLNPHKAFDAIRAYRFGVERNQGLLVRSVGRDVVAPRLPFEFRGNAAVTSLKPGTGGKSFVVRLYNPAEMPTELSVLWRDRKAHRLWRSNFFEKPIEELSGAIPLSGYEVVTLILER